MLSQSTGENIDMKRKKTTKKKSKKKSKFKKNDKNLKKIKNELKTPIFLLFFRKIGIIKYIIYLFTKNYASSKSRSKPGSK